MVLETSLVLGNHTVTLTAQRWTFQKRLPAMICEVLSCFDLTPREYASLPCGHLDFESAVAAQKDEFKAVSTARLHVKSQELAKKRDTWPRYLLISQYNVFAMTVHDENRACIRYEISPRFSPSYMVMVTNPGQRKWRQKHISAVSFDEFLHDGLSYRKRPP